MLEALHVKRHRPEQSDLSGQHPDIEIGVAPSATATDVVPVG